VAGKFASTSAGVATNLAAVNSTFCASGYWSSAGASSCTLTSSGYFASKYGVSVNLGATSFTACSKGKYSSSTGATTCVSADAGSYTTINGIEATSAATGQTKCASGTYTDTTGKAYCSIVEPGAYASTAMASGVSSSLGAQGFTNCSSGYYVSTAKALVCLLVPKMHYGSRVEGDAPVAVNQGANGATPCPDMYYSFAGASACTVDPDPTSFPTSQPTRQPTSQPSRQPTGQPNAHPTSRPTKQPSNQPSSQPSTHPSPRPTPSPTPKPTEAQGINEIISGKSNSVSSYDDIIIGASAGSGVIVLAVIAYVIYFRYAKAKFRTNTAGINEISDSIPNPLQQRTSNVETQDNPVPLHQRATLRQSFSSRFQPQTFRLSTSETRLSSHGAAIPSTLVQPSGQVIVPPFGMTTTTSAVVKQDDRENNL